jgi:hypothetical protein
MKLSFLKCGGNDKRKNLSDFLTYSVLKLAATIHHQRFWFPFSVEYFVTSVTSPTGTFLFSCSLLKELTLLSLALSSEGVMKQIRLNML